MKKNNSKDDKTHNSRIKTDKKERSEKYGKCNVEEFQQKKKERLYITDWIQEKLTPVSRFVFINFTKIALIKDVFFVYTDFLNPE